MGQPQKYADAAQRQKAYRTRQAERIRAISEGKLPPAPAIGTMPAEQRWKRMQEEARQTLEALRDEMQAYFDARTEEWQDSDRGSSLQERIESIESVIGDLED